MACNWCIYQLGLLCEASKPEIQGIRSIPHALFFVLHKRDGSVKQLLVSDKG